MRSRDLCHILGTHKIYVEWVNDKLSKLIACIVIIAKEAWPHTMQYYALNVKLWTDSGKKVHEILLNKRGKLQKKIL